MALKFHKVSSLPETLESDSFYFVLNDTYAESYLTSSSGVARSIGNSSMIQDLATSAVAAAIADLELGGGNQVELLTDMDALDDLVAAATSPNKIVLVADASAHPTVTSGPALFIYIAATNTYIKVAEYESMDIQLTWASITGKPTSAVADIDDAVTKRHAHSNLTVLNKLSETGGKLAYDGSVVGTAWASSNW